MFASNCVCLCVCVYVLPWVEPLYLSFWLQDVASGMVVADIRIISEKQSIPHGYCYIAEHLEPSEYKDTHTPSPLSI